MFCYKLRSFSISLICECTVFSILFKSLMHSLVFVYFCSPKRNESVNKLRQNFVSAYHNKFELLKVANWGQTEEALVQVDEQVVTSI